MEYKETYLDELGVKAECRSYEPESGVAEWYVMLHVEPRQGQFGDQMTRMDKAEEALLQREEMQGAQVVMRRYFLSDATNQMPLIEKAHQAGTSCIQQPPLDGSKVALWLYLQRGTEVKAEGNAMVAEHNGYRHIWHMGMTQEEGDSYTQTQHLLEQYESKLAQHGATLADNCIRTWFYTRDVDTQYSGMVKARRENFAQNGLTPDTHYISSTGIGGVPAQTKAIHQLGAYAIAGESFRTGQVQYLYALTHLNKTIEYGVTFERGTKVMYGDRDHILISGTASIDNQGNVMHVGDIEKQTRRMWENVDALLQEAGASMEDVMQIVVYLRDMADYEVVREMFRQRLPQMPIVFTLAPVCRPTWLIEMECMAVKENRHPEFCNL